MRRRLLLAAVWVAGTTVAIVLSVSAVGMVGRSVAGRDMALVSPARVEQELAATTTTTGAAEAAVDDDLAHSVDTSESPSDSLPVTSGGETVSGAGVEIPEPSAGAGPSGPSGESSPTLSPSAAEEVYDTKGGTVGVRCTGSTIALLYATPAPGWGIHESVTTGPVEVEVRFEPATDAHGSEVRVRVKCQSGTPVEEIRED